MYAEPRKEIDAGVGIERDAEYVTVILSRRVSPREGTSRTHRLYSFVNNNMFHRSAKCRQQ